MAPIKIQPISFQRKIRNPKMVSTINKLCSEWGLSHQDTIAKIINDGLLKESKRLEIQ